MQTQVMPETEADHAEILKRDKKARAAHRTKPVEILTHMKSGDPFYVLSVKKTQHGVHVSGMFRGKHMTMRRTLFRKGPAGSLYNWKGDKKEGE